MKRIIYLILTFTLFIVSLLPVSATNENAIAYPSLGSPQITYYDDGSYTKTTVEIIGCSSNARSTTKTIEGQKEIELYNSSDELVWVYTLIGTYKVVVGQSATCLNSTYLYTIYDSKWSMTAHDNYCSANVAYGTATFKKKVLFITTNTYNIDAELGCDVNGNLS